MTIFEMMGAWGGFEAFAYELMVAHGMDALYERAASGVLATNPRATLLDIGCGSGAVAAKIAMRRPDLAVEAVDLSPAMVRRAKRRAAREGIANLTIRRADAMDLPFEDGSFDAVTSFASIKHWPDRAKGVAEIHRVLKPGGRALIVEADRSCTFETAERFAGLWRLGRIPLFRRANLMYFRTFVAGQSLDLDDARDLFAASGFSSFEVTRDEEMPILLILGEKTAAAAPHGRRKK